MDNYSGHMSYFAATYGAEVGLHQFGLVPHATNVMQPLDVCIMKSFKDFIYKVQFERKKLIIKFLHVPVSVAHVLVSV